MPIEYTPRFEDQFARLPLIAQGKILKAIRLLDADFRHPGLRSHPVKSAKGIFEAYIDSKYRMTFERRGNVLFLRNVDNHDDCLKNP